MSGCEELGTDILYMYLSLLQLILCLRLPLDWGQCYQHHIGSNL